MKIRVCLLATTVLLTPLYAHAAWFSDDVSAPPPVCINNTQVSAVFSPSESVADTLVQAIASAKHSVHLAAQHFNSKPVAIALLQASRAGKDIKIIVDNSELATGYSGATFFAAMGMQVRFSPKDISQMSTYMIVDDTDLFMGNIAAAEDSVVEKHTDSNVLILHHSPDIVARYAQDFQGLWNAGSPPPPPVRAGQKP